MIPRKLTNSLLLKVTGNASGEIWSVGEIGTIINCSGNECIEHVDQYSSDLVDVFVNYVNRIYTIDINGSLRYCIGTVCFSNNLMKPATAIVGQSRYTWIGGTMGFLTRLDANQGDASKPVATGITDTLQSMWMSSSGEVWAVGSRSMIRCSASSCSSLPWVATDDLISVWGSSSGEVWAVGKAGNVVKCSGAACSLLPKVSDDNLHKVAGDERGVVWALGGGSSVVRCSGSACEKIALQGVAALADLWVSGAGEVWVAGGFGAILSFAP